VAHADAVVVGAGLSGLTAAISLAEAGATVHVLATGHAATHWSGGGLDVAGPHGAATTREGLEQLARIAGHPCAVLAADFPAALAWLQATLSAEGLTYTGDLDTPIQAVPTAIGGTRRAAILPAAQTPARDAWTQDERLVICGLAGFKDFWPAAIAASLRRPEVWGDSLRPDRVEAVTVALPGVADRRNLNALELARRFDEPAWRNAALDAIARALDAAGLARGPGRVALPAVLGLNDHANVLGETRRRLPLEPFEIPLVPPSVPGIRLFQALRAALRRNGGRIHTGEAITRVEVDRGRVVAIATAAAVREFRVRTDALVLATGGIAGGGLVAHPDGRIEESVLDLPVDAPPVEHWLNPDPLEPSGHPLEAAGLRTDGDLRPVRLGGSEPLLENVRIVGSLLAGQRYLRERCGDGVAFTSGRRAAASLRPAGTATAVGLTTGRGGQP
jgi:glycerol-3-phosphate dehydrogenase subunit B